MEYQSPANDKAHQPNGLFQSGRNPRPFFAPVFIQPKLTVNTPGDPYEQEADEMANRVMQMPKAQTGGSSPAFFSPSPPDLVHRKCAHCEEEEKKRVQRKESGPTAENEGGTLDSYVNGLDGKGQPLPPESNSFFASRMGRDFSDVRVHTGADAARSATSISALAYTTGNNIVFNTGQYSPGTDPGKKLLAHELTHVIQQSGGKNFIQRDYAKELPNPEAVAPALTADQVADAIRFNQRTLRDAWEIALIRDVIGLEREPSVIDADFVNSLAEYQAENNITADGKLGPVTSARLSGELRSEGQILTPAERGELSRSSRRMGTRAMRINVNNAAHVLDTRGGADYGVMWSVPDTSANGFVIQHLRVATNVRDCAGNAVAANNFAGTNDYWETWRVVNGRVRCGTLGVACAGSDDTFTTIQEAANTTGTITMTGHVSFFPDYSLNAQWAITAPGVHPAGDLPHRTTTPPEWNEGETMVHQMTVNYNDCVAPATSNVASRPR